MEKRFFAVTVILAALLELFLAYSSYCSLNPFPYEDFAFCFMNGMLRDGVLLSALWGLYFRRKRIPDRIRRYFPVVAAGILYFIAAVFMVRQLSLGWGLQTVLAVLSGINNNIFLVLIAAMCYHKWPNIFLKGIYFVIYLFTVVTIIGDAFYFWQTSMHVESVLFQNLNIYSVKGILATVNTQIMVAVGAVVLLFVFLFRVEKPGRRKPNFAWSLLCVAMFTLGLNLSERLLGFLTAYGVEKIIGVYVEVENEKTRVMYRNMLSVPINVNFIAKALFDTDKMAGVAHVEQRELSERDKKYLEQLGISEEKTKMPLIPSQYDRVVMLILESVHRDYINYYNSSIPEEATPFLNSLVVRYPSMSNFYSSAVPTTQGLNALFRSHLLLDKDVPGAINPSLYKIVQAAGMRGIFMNASSQYYSNELREYPDQFGMKEYYAKEYLEKRGYTGASGWGFHNDVLYEETLHLLEEGKNERMLLVTKTLDMHQPYPYTGYAWAEMPENVRDNKNFTVRGLYWVDKTLENFFRQAENKGLMDDRTLFIITSDHNPHSGGEYTKLVSKAEDKKSVAPIPLIFVSKNLRPLDALRTGEYASQIDVAPTILYLLGLETPSKFMGRNLLLPSAKPYALGYFGGKAYYWAEDRHLEDRMDNPEPSSPYEDALTNYIVHYYGLWHRE